MLKLTLPQADVAGLVVNRTPVDCSSASPHVQFLQAFFLPEPGPHAAETR